MAEWFVAKQSEFDDGDRFIVECGEKEVGVFRKGDTFYAYENTCCHQGGPVCEGMVIGKVLQQFSAGGQLVAEGFSEEEVHIVCPWHGWEYNLATGVCATDSRLRLKSCPVVQKGEDIYVVC